MTNENDRDLLEMAARAAGVDGNYADIHPEFGDEWEESGIWYNNENDCADCWNPLIDDGDALRLAVKLKLEMEFFNENNFEGSIVCAQFGNYCCMENTALNPDLFSATRRAITRAAAEIGRGML